MGGSASRQSSTNAFLGFVSDTAIRSHAGCLVSASASSSFDIRNIAQGNVEFKNVNIGETATSTLDCTQSININIDSLQSQVDQAIDALVAASGTTMTAGRASGISTVKSIVKQGLTVNNVKEAMAGAVTSYKLTVKDRGSGNVSVSDFDVIANASARLTNILQNTKVSTGAANTMSMADAIGGLLALEAQAQTPCSSEDQTQKKTYAMSYALLIIVISIIAVLAHRRSLF